MLKISIKNQNVSTLRTKIHIPAILIIDGFDYVHLPLALDKQYPNTNTEFKYSYLFLIHSISKDPSSNKQIRYLVLPAIFSRNIKKSVRLAYIDKKVSAHTFWHSYATHLLQNNISIHTISDFLRYKNRQTVMIYTHIVKEN